MSFTVLGVSVSRECVCVVRLDASPEPDWGMRWLTVGLAHAPDNLGDLVFQACDAAAAWRLERPIAAIGYDPNTGWRMADAIAYRLKVDDVCEFPIVGTVPSLASRSAAGRATPPDPCLARLRATGALPAPAAWALADDPDLAPALHAAARTAEALAWSMGVRFT